MRGVRQGCERGPMIFLTPSTSWPRKLLRTILREEGTVMSLPASSGELWDRDTAVVTARARSLQGQSVVHHSVEEILDVCLVDDGCHMIANKQAAELVKRNASPGSHDRFDILKISTVGEHGQREDGGHVGA